MKKNITKLKIIGKKTINNIVTKKEWGVQFTRNDTKGKVPYPRRFTTTRKSTRKAINDTTKKEGEVDLLKATPKERNNTKGS